MAYNNHESRPYVDGLPTRLNLRELGIVKRNPNSLLFQLLELQPNTGSSKKSETPTPGSWSMEVPALELLDAENEPDTKEVIVQQFQIENLFDDEKCPDIVAFMQLLKVMADKELVVVSSLESQQKPSESGGVKTTGEYTIVSASAHSDVAQETGAKVTRVKDIYTQLEAIWTATMSLELEKRGKFYHRKRIGDLMIAFEIPNVAAELSGLLPKEEDELSELLHPAGSLSRNAVKERFLGLLIQHIENEAKNPTKSSPSQIYFREKLDQ